jgi:hypothetical protein
MGPQARALFEKASNSGYNPGYPDVSSAVFETSQLPTRRAQPPTSAVGLL